MQPLGMSSPLRRIHPRVADANRLLNEAASSVRLAKEIAWIAASRAGGLRVLVASTVPAEVEEHLGFRARKARVDEQRMRVAWRERIAPLLRVVDPGVPDRTELAQVAERDPDDLSTGALAAILGPGSTWSADHDLLNPGLAEPYVLELVIAIREASVLDVKLITGAKIATRVAAVGTELVRALARLDTRGRFVAGAFALSGIAAATYALRRNPDARDRIVIALQRVGAEVMRQLAADHALQIEWRDRVPVPLSLDTPRPERALARVLAAAPAPLSVEEIGQVLRGSPASANADGIRAQLRTHPMFLRNGRGQWQLGERFDQRTLF